MSFVTKLKCAKCGEEHRPEEKVLLCSKADDGRLDIFYDYEKMAKAITKDKLETRKGFWKYFELLPIDDRKNIITLGEGNTPLLKTQKLGKRLGLTSLYIKDETRNPTASFKDRPMVVGISKAVEFGAKVIVCASSGNAAAAASAYSAKAGLKCFTFVPEHASVGKIAQLILYGSHVLRFKRINLDEDPTVKMLKLVYEKYGWYTCPSFGPFNPYQAEGPKTMAYEIVEQLGWKSPDWVFIPVGGGGLLAGNWKGFKEFHGLGFVSNLPKIAAIQADGCAPLVRAFKQNKEPFSIETWSNPSTVATGLADPLPWDGDAALMAIRESGGNAESVSDPEILAAQKLLAQSEGIFAEPSGVTSLAGLIRAVENGMVDKGETVVVEVTGSGLKDPSVVLKELKEPLLIEPDTESFDNVLKKLNW